MYAHGECFLKTILSPEIASDPEKSNHRKTSTAQAASRSRAARCSLNALREAEVFD